MRSRQDHLTGEIDLDIDRCLPLQPKVEQARLWASLYGSGYTMIDANGNIKDSATWHLAVLTAKIDAIAINQGLAQTAQTAMASDVSVIKMSQAAMTQKLDGMEKRVEQLEDVVGPMAERSQKLIGVGVAVAAIMAMFGAGATHWFEIVWSKLVGEK